MIAESHLQRLGALVRCKRLDVEHVSERAVFWPSSVLVGERPALHCLSPLGTNCGRTTATASIVRQNTHRERRARRELMRLATRL